MDNNLDNYLNEVAHTEQLHNNLKNYAFGNVPQALTKASRGPISSLFNANQVSAEDYARDLYKQSQQNAFNKEMIENQYQMTINSMKKAGLNPILAFGSGTQNSAYGSSTGSPAGQGSSTDIGSILQFVATIGQIFAGLYTSAGKNATSLAVANTTRNVRSVSNVVSNNTNHNFSYFRKK